MSKGYDLGLDFKPATAEHPRLINTLSFPTGARHWFPCFDSPNDKATEEVIATVRRGYSVISNGTLLSVTDHADGSRTFHWSQDLPHSTYLFVLAAGPYVELKDSLGSLPIDYWVYPKDSADAWRSFRKTPEIIDFFNKEFGFPYPWAKYDQITIPGIGGGAESTTATVVGESTIHDERADVDFPSHWLVAHEAAHQWWGDLITMRDWSQTWLNESFATYSEYRYSRYSLGEDEGALNLLNKKNQYLNEARTKYKRPIVFDRWNYPNENFDAHTYPKGAAVLNMLHWIMGDRPFHRALSYFLHSHAFQPVDTHDLLIAIRESTGQVLDWFFEEWIYKAGHPVFDVSSSWDEQTHRIHLNVVQKQGTSEWIPIFRMPVLIGITTASGKRVERVWIKGREESYTFDSPERPLLVRFDEGNHLLKEWTYKKSLDELLYQLEHDDVIGRLWAAGELKDRVSDSRVSRALQRRAESDSFWAVRRSAIDILAEGHGGDLKEFFMRRAQDEKSRVRASALHALGLLGDSSLVPFLRGVFEKDRSYVVCGAALKALASCGGEAVKGYLEDASRLPSYRDIIRKAAIDGLKIIH